MNNLFFNQICLGYNTTPTTRLTIFTSALNPVAIFELGQIYFLTNSHKYKKKRDMTSVHKQLYGEAWATVSHKRSSCTPQSYLQFPFPLSLVFWPHIAGCIKMSMSCKAGVHTRQNCVINGLFYLSLLRMRYAVTQLVEALRYKPEGRGFDSRLCHWIFHLHNPSGCTMVLGSTQPLTEMSTRNFSWR